jgi:hypothetical protein
MLAQSTFKPGESYLTVICDDCKARFPLFRDINKGRSALLVAIMLPVRCVVTMATTPGNR